MKKLITAFLLVLGGFSLTAQNALNFPDNDDYGTVPNDVAFEFNDDFTFESWFKVNGGGYQTILSTDSLTGSGHLGYWMGVTPTGQPGFQLFHGTFAWTTLVGTTSVNDNQWHHMAVTNDGTTIYMVVDGVQEGSESYVAPTYGGNGHKLDIGVDQEGNYITGTIDDVRMWSKAIPVTEINLYKDSCLTGMEDSLVALYKFDETAGSTFADASPSGLNGTLTNMTDMDWVDGIVCVTPVEYTVSALEFDGIDDNVELDTTQISQFAFNGNFTIETWINAGTQTSQFGTLVSNVDDLISSGFILALNNGLPVFEMEATASNTLIGTTNVTDGTCHHIAAVYDTDSMFLYVDGALDAAIAGPAAAAATQSLWIGGNHINGDYFEGKISQMRFWNDARTSSEILMYLDSSFVGSSDASLVAFYEFDGNSGQSTLNDQRASGNIHGTLMNMDVNSAWVVDSCMISGEDTAGLYDYIQLEGLDVTVYPNPTQGTVNVELNETSNASIQVYSVDGQLVYDATNITNGTHEFELQDKAGIYHMIITSNGRKDHVKLVKI